MQYKGYGITRAFPSGMYIIRPEIKDASGNYYTTLQADTLDGLKELVDDTVGVIVWED